MVLLASTGVIGEPLDDHMLTSHLPEMMENLSPASWDAAVEAIRTTDTFAKGASATAVIDGTSITITGIAKAVGDGCPRYGDNAGIYRH